MNILNSCIVNDMVFVLIDMILFMVEVGLGFILDCDNNVFILDGIGFIIGDIVIYNWFFLDLVISIVIDILMVEISSLGVYYLEVINMINGCSVVDFV